MSHQIYTYEEFLNMMSYLFPTAVNFVNNKSIQVPINEQSTIVALNKLFKSENTNNDEQYGYNLWHTAPQKFVSTFLYNYWSDDPLIEINADLQTLKPLSYHVMQYIALSIINLNNRHSDNGLTYDLNSIQFNSLEELTELFQYMSSLKFVDYTQVVTNVLGNVTSNVNSRLNSEIKLEQSKKYAKDDEERKSQEDKSQNEIKQKLLEAGLTEPTMSVNSITISLMSLTRQFNEIFLKELAVRREFATKEKELISHYETHVSASLSSFFADRAILLNNMCAEISMQRENLIQLQTSLNNLKRESKCRDEYDKLVWGNVSHVLTQTLENLQNSLDSDNMILVE